MTDVEVQASIVQRLGALIGRPSRLVQPSAVVLSALLTLTARLLRLTMRAVDEPEHLRMLAEGKNLVSPDTVAAFRRGEPVSDPSLPEDTDPAVTALMQQLFIELLRPVGVKQPSHLVLGALETLCGQLATLRGESLESLLPTLKERFARVTPKQVAAFQDFASSTRAN